MCQRKLSNQLKTCCRYLCITEKRMRHEDQTLKKTYTFVGILHVCWCKRVMVDYEIISLSSIQSNYSHLVWPFDRLAVWLIKLSPNKQCHVCHEWKESYTTILYSQNVSIITVSYCVRIHKLCHTWSLFDDMHCLPWYLMLSQSLSWGFMFKSVVYTNHVISFHEYGHSTSWTSLYLEGINTSKHFIKR